jgi:hypothetical protein
MVMVMVSAAARATIACPDRGNEQRSGGGKKFHRRPLRRSAIGGGRYFLSELTGTVTPSLFAPRQPTMFRNPRAHSVGNNVCS